MLDLQTLEALDSGSDLSGEGSHELRRGSGSVESVESKEHGVLQEGTKRVESDGEGEGGGEVSIFVNVLSRRFSHISTKEY